jgi:hypothetical protein
MGINCLEQIDWVVPIQIASKNAAIMERCMAIGTRIRYPFSKPLAKRPEEMVKTEMMLPVAETPERIVAAGISKTKRTRFVKDAAIGE